MDNAGTILFIIVMGLVPIVSCFGNILLIFVCVRHRKFHSPIYVMICNLAALDIIMAFVVVPQKLHDLFHQGDYFKGKCLN